MIVTQNNQRLFLTNWGYNACRITTALATIVENNGGKVKPQNNAVISNRTVERAKRDIKLKIERFEAIPKEKGIAEKRAEYIKHQRAELERLEAVNNEPITVTHTSYISFVLDGIYYYYQTNDNPFFDFYYTKTPVINGKYSRDAASEIDPKDWLYDCFFRFDTSDADIIEAANLIFNMLINAKNGVIIRDKQKKRVPNLYDGGYHYETIYEKERFETLGEWAK